MNNTNPLYLLTESLNSVENRQVYINLVELEELIYDMCMISRYYNLKRFLKKYKHTNQANYNEYAGAANEKMYNRFVDIYNEMRKDFLPEINTIDNLHEDAIWFIKKIKNTNFKKLDKPFVFDNEMLKKIIKYLNKRRKIFG